MKGISIVWDMQPRFVKFGRVTTREIAIGYETSRAPGFSKVTELSQDDPITRDTRTRYSRALAYRKHPPVFSEKIRGTVAPEDRSKNIIVMEDRNCRIDSV